MVMVKIEQLIENQQYKPNDIGHWVHSYSLIKYIMIWLFPRVANSQMNVLVVDYLININYRL